MMSCADLCSLKHPKKHCGCLGKQPSPFRATRCQPQRLHTAWVLLYSAHGKIYPCVASTDGCLKHLLLAGCWGEGHIQPGGDPQTLQEPRAIIQCRNQNKSPILQETGPQGFRSAGDECRHDNPACSGQQCPSPAIVAACGLGDHPRKRETCSVYHINPFCAGSYLLPGWWQLNLLNLCLRVVLSCILRLKNWVSAGRNTHICRAWWVHPVTPGYHLRMPPSSLQNAGASPSPPKQPYPPIKINILGAACSFASPPAAAGCSFRGGIAPRDYFCSLAH